MKVSTELLGEVQKKNRNIRFPVYDKCTELDNLGQGWQLVLCCVLHICVNAQQRIVQQFQTDP